MNSILGRIQLGSWELGQTQVSNGEGVFNAVTEATLGLTISGGTPLKSFSSILGTITLGKFELGSLTTVSTQALLGKGNFVATSEPTLTLIAFTDVSGTFTATANPLCSFATGINFLASAEPTLNVAATLLPGFIASANPKMRVFFDTNESQKDLVSDPLQRTIKLVNFTY